MYTHYPFPLLPLSILLRFITHHYVILHTDGKTFITLSSFSLFSLPPLLFFFYYLPILFPMSLISLSPKRQERVSYMPTWYSPEGLSPTSSTSWRFCSTHFVPFHIHVRHPTFLIFRPPVPFLPCFFSTFSQFIPPLLLLPLQPTSAFVMSIFTLLVHPFLVPFPSLATTSFSSNFQKRAEVRLACCTSIVVF